MKATTVDWRPARSSSRRSDSRPISKRRMTTPISARAWRISDSWTKPTPPRQQPARDGRLADALHRLAGQLGREPDDRQAEQELAESHLLSLLHSAIRSAA